MTPTEKQAAKDNLRKEITSLQLNTFQRWLYLFEAEENIRAAAGYSKGVEEMCKQLALDYRKDQKKLMKPFDRGDYD